MSVYSKLKVVRTEDLDELQHVNNVKYVQWIQDISREHWESVVDKEITNEMVWVVRNHNITYFEGAMLNDSLQLSTKILGWKGPISTREVVIRNNKIEKTLVKAITEWCAVHPKTLKPIRVPAKVVQLFISGNEDMA